MLGDSKYERITSREEALKQALKELEEDGGHVLGLQGSGKPRVSLQIKNALYWREIRGCPVLLALKLNQWLNLVTIIV